jgi:16S rRNA (cytidine1402-2'-O)-methyltransferase
MTLRALRISHEATLIVADTDADLIHVGCLLARHGIATPLAISLDSGLFAITARVLDTLKSGDVAFLISGLSPALSDRGHRLVRAARDNGFPIESVPGPSLPVTALVTSGFPAGCFRYLGELVQQTSAHRALLSSVVAERCTLVLQVPSGQLSEVLPDLAGSLGERPLALVWAPGGRVGDIWRGMIGSVPEEYLNRRDPTPVLLVVGRAREWVACWDEDRLRAEIRVCRNQGLGAKEISQQLAGESGWPRRDIYRLAAGAG